jgi:hypothetical protein
MDAKRLTFDLAVYEVSMTDNWTGPDYAKEHFEKGVFIVHDGITYQLCSWNGGSEYVYVVGIPTDFILGVMAKEIKKATENALSELLLSMSNAITTNRKVLDMLRDEISAHTAVVNEMWDGVVYDMKDNHKEVMMKLGDMPKNVGGEGVNILDVAKSFAVIQKPELIKELNK